MLLLVAAGFGSVELAGRPEYIGSFWYFTAPLFQPGGWLDVSVWDLIQPAFVFLVGVALPFSYVHRLEYGQSWNGMLGHAAVRAVTLIVLGVLLTSTAAGRTTWEFSNVLSQIGMGYLVVFLLWRQSPVLQVGYVAAVFLGYAGMFYYYDWVESGLRAADLGLAKSDMLPGLFAPFTRDVNFAAGFDRWFLNLFPRGELFVKHQEGLQTLNFVPTIATMVLGLMAGELLQSTDRPEQKFNKLLMAGVACLVLGVAAGITICPIVKRIWTPSWVLFSSAFVIWLVAAFYGFIEVLGRRRWAFPFVVLGMNSMVAYLLLELAGPTILDAIRMHGAAELFQGEFGPIWQQCALLFSIWSACLYLYCRRVFFRV
jgi:heparan-alpha-glucosaminide N-acetyltransferase